ncbi:MAG: LysM peptidoglycan-binding domain-containing protein [Lawsonibacter sp.]
MSERVQIYLEETAGIELILPITPQGYQWDTAIVINKVTIDGLGELNLPGRPKLAEEVVEGMLPAQDYPFNQPGAVTSPRSYLDQLERWCKTGTVLRYLVVGAGLNKPVILERVRWYEQDGTNNVYYRIEHREYTAAETPVVSGGTVADTRSTDTQAASAVNYTVAKGDTLWSLCRRFYGETSTALCQKVASANGIKNINLIYTGQGIRFPARAEL